MFDQVIDIRSRLPRKSWEIGRQPRKTTVTLHYNGSAIPDQRRAGEGVLEQLHIDCDWQMRPEWNPPTSGADGLQYHYVVDAEGKVYQTRDTEAILWHCKHNEGNAHSIAVHLPLGGNQDATLTQWAATEALCDALLSQFTMSGRAAVKGHYEWSQSACPGPHIKRRLLAYRDEPPTVWIKPPAPYRVLRTTSVQHTPDGSQNIALVLAEGTVVKIGALVTGQYRAWIANGTGFVLLDDLQPLEEHTPDPASVASSSVSVNSPMIHPARVDEQTMVEVICSRDTGNYTRQKIELFIVPAYVQICQSVGVDPLLALAQMCHETGNLTSWWAAPPRRNPAGLGVDGRSSATPFADTIPAAWDGSKYQAGLSFKTWARHAIPAHVGRLVAYATEPDKRTVEQQTLVDVALGYRPLPAEYHGCAPTPAGLTGTWATDPEYAGKLIQWANRLQGN